MLAHELAHAVRWGKNSEWSKDLFCELVSEGLAVHIEAEFAKTQKDRTFFLKTILAHDDNKNRKILKKLERQLKAKTIIIPIYSLEATSGHAGRGTALAITS